MNFVIGGNEAEAENHEKNDDEGEQTDASPGSSKEYSQSRFFQKAKSDNRANSDMEWEYDYPDYDNNKLKGTESADWLVDAGNQKKTNECKTKHECDVKNEQFNRDFAIMHRLLIEFYYQDIDCSNQDKITLIF